MEIGFDGFIKLSYHMPGPCTEQCAAFSSSLAHSSVHPSRHHELCDQRLFFAPMITFRRFSLRLNVMTAEEGHDA